MIDLLLKMSFSLNGTFFRYLPIVMTFVILIDFIIKGNKIKFSYRFIRFALLLKWVLFIALLLFKNEILLNFLSRATGPYWWTFMITTIGSLLLPIFLLFQKWGTNKLFLFLICLFSCFGLIMEPIVIILTSIHQDYFSSTSYNNSLIGKFLMPAVIYTCFLIATDIILSRFRNKEQKTASTEQNQNVLDN